MTAEITPLQQRHFVFRTVLPCYFQDAVVILVGREMGYTCVVADDCIVF